METAQPYVWVEDDEVSECTRCSTGFGLFNRKHHCRRCGKVFCDKCSKNRTKLPPEDGYGDEKVRVCQPCYEIVTGKRKALPEAMGAPGEPGNYAQDRVNLFGNQTDSRAGGGGWLGKLGQSDSEKDLASMDKEIAKLQVKSLNDAAHAIEVNADTLEHIVLRSEQTKEDLRKIENIHATHAAADLLIAKMERGIFNLGGKSGKFKPPPAKASDHDFEVQVSGRFKWTRRILRLTDDFFLRLSSSGDAVLDTVNYSQLEGVYVRKKSGCFSVRFNRKGVKPWELYALDPAKVVRGVVERAMRRGYRVVVGFEDGAKQFDCDFAAAIHDNMVTGEGYGLVSSMSTAVKQHGRIEDDAYQRALQESLLQLADIGRLQQQGLEQHMEDLDEMEQQLPNLLDSVAKHNERVRNIR